LAIGLAFVAVGAVVAQPNPRLDKDTERRKFHSTPVRGTSAEDRAKAFADRLRHLAATPFGGLTWRNVGPEKQGGRVIDIESPASDPDAVYVAFATGGLYRTRDDGMTWESLFDGQSTYGIGDIAVSRDGKTLWLGSGEANSQRTSYAGTGVFKSTDAGKTWANVGLPESHHIGKVLIDARDERTVFVAALGHLYSTNQERGIYRTRDGGNSWQHVLAVDGYTGGIDLIQDSRNPKVLVASLWDRDRRAWNFRESGAGSAVYRSEDGGTTWRQVTGLPTGTAAGRTGLGVCDGQPNVMYAFVDNQSDDPDWALADERVPGGRVTVRRLMRMPDALLGELDPKVLGDFLRSYPKAKFTAEAVIADAKAGKMTVAQLRQRIEAEYPDTFKPDIVSADVYRSEDSGKSWRKLPPVGQFGGYYWGEIYVSPVDPNEIFICGVPLLRSRDGGQTWEEVAGDAHVDHHSVHHDRRTPNKVWIGNDGGVYLSLDGGKTVRHLNNLSVAQATTLAVDNARPYNVYVGNQDNGTMRGPSTYEPGRSDLSLWKDLFGGDGSAIGIDPRPDRELTYVSYQFGQFFALETGKETRFITPRAAAGEPELRYNWIAPLVISTHHNDILYIGSQFVHRSLNQGRTWDVISPDLTRNRPNGDVPHSTIKDLSESPFKFGVIVAGTDDGLVQLTRNGGATWEDISTPTPDKWVCRVIASKHDAKTIYVGQTGYREDDFRAYLWKSTDFGKTWTSIVGDLPAESVNVIREDPKAKDTLYVGTDMGAYVSFNGGKNWHALSGGMSNLPVHDLVIQERQDELVAATHARGAFILPLKYVRKYSPELADKGLQWLELDDMRRLPSWGYANRDAWDKRPAPSPRTTAVVFSPEAGDGAWQVLDASGKALITKSVKLTRGFNSLTISPEVASEQRAPSTLTITTPKTAKDALADPNAAYRAQYLAPGDYTIVISIGGKKTERKWRITD
jgi:photosystem II stability/assembly factor-like uncharacterized protein